MPEGPSILILKESLKPFNNKKLVEADGTTTVSLEGVAGKKVVFRSWGKHLLICFPKFFLRIHLMMFGTYRINERKKGKAPRLRLEFANGEANFYSCNIKRVEGDVDDHYDWEVDVMSGEWNARKAKSALTKHKDEMICDVLLDQDVFSGVGNIIKNEVLFRTRVHPESIVGKIPARKRTAIINDAPVFSQLFYEWKKVFKLKKNLQIYKKKKCPNCGGPVTKKYMGRGKRLTCFCGNCQTIY